MKKKGKIRNRAGFQLFSNFEAKFMVMKWGTVIPIFEGMDVNSSIRMPELDEFVYSLDEMLAKASVHTVTFQTIQQRSLYHSPICLMPLNAVSRKQ